MKKDKLCGIKEQLKKNTLRLWFALVILDKSVNSGSLTPQAEIKGSELNHFP